MRYLVEGNLKLQMLLAKGAALGMHFIFSSQGFTSGTRGLNDFSKKQIQQRIAMKTEYHEIKETLDLNSPSDADRFLMEQLAVHHALVRVPMDKRGNHILQSKVLYLSDYSLQERMIDGICGEIRPAPRFEPENASVYIDKRTLIVDGASYHSFESSKSAMEKSLSKQEFSDDSMLLYLGEPRRMLDAYPVELAGSFCENLLVIAPGSEKMPAASLILSLHRSLQLQNRDIALWTDGREGIYRTLVSNCGQRDMKTARGIEEVCREIQNTRRRVEQGSVSKECIVLLGFETLIQDMAFYVSAPTGAKSALSGRIERRAQGQPGLLAQLEALSRGFSSEQQEQAPAPGFETEEPSGSPVYDAREDLKFILTQGPKYGIHFVTLFKNMAEFQQTKLDAALFRHKALFLMSKGDALPLVGSGGAAAVSELSGHSFRYTNGVESVTFRPYLHEGLSWDGWQMGDAGAVNASDEEELLL